MHLATGEWIAVNRAFPTVEPFAWTRAGEPYFAYSWLPELAYWYTLEFAGAPGLRILHGLEIAAATAAAGTLGIVMGWRRSTVLVVAVVHTVVTAALVAALRPQAVLFVTVPLAYAVTYHTIRDGNQLRWLLCLTLLSAVSANSHLLFPLLGLPLIHALGNDSIPWRRMWSVAIALALGLLISPYALNWLDIFRLIFGENAMLNAPSPISEFTPGFRRQKLFSIVGIVAISLAALPWLLNHRALRPRRRLVLGTLWLAGLITFALAVRSILIWWFAMLPLVGHLFHALQDSDSGKVRPRPVIVGGVLLLSVISINSITRGSKLWPGDAGLANRAVPTPYAREIEPLARWLDSNAHPLEPARVLTTFNYGSFLTFRLPGYTMSVDARTIFPDSAALPNAFVVPSRREILGPIGSADLAILHWAHPAGAVLDTASTWLYVGRTYGRSDNDEDRLREGAVLWVRKSWFAQVRTSPPGLSPELREDE